jgi:hypothetical protein
VENGDRLDPGRAEQLRQPVDRDRTGVIERGRLGGGRQRSTVRADGPETPGTVRNDEGELLNLVVRMRNGWK